jgi:hypothetical protein
MKEVILKYSFKKYNTVLFQNSSPIDYVSNFQEEEIETDIFGSEYSTKLIPPNPEKPLYLHEHTFTNDEEKYVQHYGNPMATVSQYNVTIVIEEEGDKLALKLFTGYRERRRGTKFFKVVKNVNYLTVNKKTGDVYIGYLYNYQNKRKFTKQLRRNYFQNMLLNIFKIRIRNFLSELKVNDTPMIADSVIGTFIDRIDGNYNPNLSQDERLFLFYLRKRGIKYPNNFNVFRSELIGPSIRKKLKKNGGKLVDAFMSENNLRGKVLKKVLHECDRINLNVYQYAVNLFGEDKLNQDVDGLKKILNSPGYVNNPQHGERLKQLMTPSELERYYKMFKNVYGNDGYDIYTLSDHVRFYVKLKSYGEDIKWMSDGSDRNFYQNEHLDWTDKLEHYQQGVFNRIYPKILDELLSKEIDGYSPVLLKTSNEYNEESSHQSNCVKGYINRAASIIISLRKNNERATIEYKINLKDEKISIDRVQTLGKFNSRLSEEWNGVLFKLDEIMLHYGKHEEFRLPDILKETKNGIKIHSESKWYGLFLNWENDKINDNGNVFLLD